MKKHDASHFFMKSPCIFVHHEPGQRYSAAAATVIILCSAMASQSSGPLDSQRSGRVPGLCFVGRKKVKLPLKKQSVW